MNLILSRLKRATNVINKKLTSEKNLGNNCILADNTSVTSPTVIIGGIRSLDSISDYNYAYIPPCHRYYYINDIIALSGGRVKLVLTVDVLKTYASDILASKQLITAEKDIGKMYLSDAQWTTDARTYNRAIYFNGDYFNSSNDCFMLVTV